MASGTNKPKRPHGGNNKKNGGSSHSATTTLQKNANGKYSAT